MKLIVQIPCHNEEDSLAEVIENIPRNIVGIQTVEVLVIDDGSTDRTCEVAREAGADHIIKNTRNMGLARTFRLGLETALKLDADIIVNTDGDHQYPGYEIPQLVQPILNETADIVIGDRKPSQNPEFSWTKRQLQKIGSKVVAHMAGIEVPDAVSGFRAFSRKAALKMNVVSNFSYTIETVIQAGRKQLNVVSIPIKTHKTKRPSRLFRNIPHFVAQSAITILRSYAMYRPLRVFMYLGLGLLFLGSIPLVRFLIHYFLGNGEGKIQSLIVGAILMTLGGLTFMFGLLADLISFNRQLSEMTLQRVRELEANLIDSKTNSSTHHQTRTLSQTGTHDSKR